MTSFACWSRSSGSVRARAIAPWLRRAWVGYRAASHGGADEDAVLGMRIGSRDGATRAHRPGLSPVPLSRVRQAVQRRTRIRFHGPIRAPTAEARQTSDRTG